MNRFKSNYSVHEPSRRTFFWIIVAICLSYFIVQAFYINYAIFSMDDLWLAYHTYHYKTALPYRDFAPYKSVLGYYIFLPTVSLPGIIEPLLYTKIWLVLINALSLGGISLWMKRFFSKKAIVTSLVLLISMPIFLLYSSEIRGDLLGFWLCLASVLLLFDKKYFFSGLCIGVGFLISQKVVWYFIATNCGLAGCWLVTDRTWKMIKSMVSFNLAVSLTLVLYILFWSYYSSLSVVLNSLFYEPYLIYSTDWFAAYRSYLWIFFFNTSTILVLLCPVALIGLVYLPVKNKIFIIIYTLMIVFFLLSCKQPFIYLPLAGIPALFIFFSSFFTAFYSLLSSAIGNNPSVNRFYHGMVFLIILAFITLQMKGFINQLPYYNGRYQKSMIHLMSKLLNDGEAYVAGVPLLLDVEQPVPGLKHLISQGIEYMHHPSKALYSNLTFDSMYLAPATAPEVIESIKATPVKLYVDNKRLHLLPKKLWAYLDTEYQHFWGSIYLYAPKIQAGRHLIQVKFPGDYKVDAKMAIYIDNKKVAPHSIIALKNQRYLSDAHATYRLVLSPQHLNHLLDPQDKKNKWNDMLD